MTPDLKTLVAELRAKAELATQGKWESVRRCDFEVVSCDDKKWMVISREHLAGVGSVAGYVVDGMDVDEQAEHDTAFVAGCSPDVILALLDALSSEYARGYEDGCYSCLPGKRPVKP